MRERGGGPLMSLCWGGQWEARTHVPEIVIQDLDITIDDFQRREFVVPRRDPAHDENPKHPNTQVRKSVPSDEEIHVPSYPKKLHILVRLASTSYVTSLTILALAFGDIVVNHFCSVTLPLGARFFRVYSRRTERRGRSDTSPYLVEIRGCS